MIIHTPAQDSIALRDMFAGLVLLGFTQRPKSIFESSLKYNDVAVEIYKLADAMMKARQP